jgi:hypothetical protein
MEKNIIICDCGNNEHQFIISSYSDSHSWELYLEPHLTNYKNVFQRILYGIKYIFGYKSKYGAFDCVIISRDKAQQMCEKILEDIQLWEQS